MSRLVLTALTLGLALTAQASAQLSTDDRQLPRDYRPRQPIIPVEPAIFTAEDKPWEELGGGLRRKTYTDDRVTFVVLEIQRDTPDTGEIQTHYHHHDQLSYVLEGEVDVEVDGVTRRIGPGGAYVVPSNVHHGIRVRTTRLVLLDVFTPTREDFRGQRAAPPWEARWNQEEIKLFVRNWFKGFDENHDVEWFLGQLADEGLEMRFPEATLGSHQEFRSWYAGILETIASARHTLQRLDVQVRDAGTYDVDLVVLWEATTTQGEELRFLAHQTWEVEDSGEPTPRIRRYLVEAAGEH